MARIICVKCGKQGSSKCPFCRSTFGGFGNAAMIDAVLSYRLVISEEGILLKRHAQDEGPETNFEILERTVNLLKELTPDELKMVACDHDWDFAPFETSSIGCGHSSEWARNGEQGFLMNALAHCRANNDVEAAEIISKILETK